MLSGMKKGRHGGHMGIALLTEPLTSTGTANILEEYSVGNANQMSFLDAYLFPASVKQHPHKIAPGQQMTWGGPSIQIRDAAARQHLPPPQLMLQILYYNQLYMPSTEV